MSNLELHQFRPNHQYFSSYPYYLPAYYSNYYPRQFSRYYEPMTHTNVQTQPIEVNDIHYEYVLNAMEVIKYLIIAMIIYYAYRYFF